MQERKESERERGSTTAVVSRRMAAAVHMCVVRRASSQVTQGQAGGEGKERDDVDALAKGPET